MRATEALLLGYLLNSLWQIPLLFAAAWITTRAAHALRSSSPATEHRIWVAALLLQALLPACSISPFAWLRDLSFWSTRVGPANSAHVSVIMDAGVGSGVLHVPANVLAAIALIYAVTIAYFLARLLWRNWKLTLLRQRAVELALTGDAALCWHQCSKVFELHDADLATSPEIFGPVTVGLRHRLVLLPAAMMTGLPIDDLRTVIAHEFAHMRRRDFSKNLLYELLTLPVAYHPLLWLTREKLIETREMICDRIAAESTGHKEYARSLLRLASLLVRDASVRTPHAIGIFDANTFERRLMKLKETHQEIHGPRRLATLAVCMAFGIATCCSALALRINVDAAAATRDSGKAASGANASTKIPAGVMAGNILTKVMPVYPESAKQAKIQGSVLLHAIIGKDGAVDNLQVISGPEQLRASALDAVRQWIYKPYVLNGDPVEVETTITITYSMPS